VGVESSFNIELGEAGDGTVEITITDPNGQLIQNQVTTMGPGLLQVNYVPTVMGDYKINVTFNGERVPACPITFNVLDSSKVLARGDGLGLVQVGVPTAFVVTAPDAKLRDLDIRVIGPSGNELMTNTRRHPATFVWNTRRFASERIRSRSGLRVTLWSEARSSLTPGTHRVSS